MIAATHSKNIVKSLIALLLIFFATTQTSFALFTYSESFQNSTAAGWTFNQGNTGPGARLTSNLLAAPQDPECGIIDAAGQGWLRLATTTGNQANTAHLCNQIIPTTGTIRAEFEFSMWKPTGSRADGITFFLYDSNATFAPGAFGGSIGYAQRTTPTCVNGVPCAYIGVALDEWGNFSNPTEGRIGGPGFTPNSVSVRGPGNGLCGYAYEAGTCTLTQQLSFNSPTRPAQCGTSYRKARVSFDEDNILTVDVQFGACQAYTNLITHDYTCNPRPSGLHMGFAAGTGGVCAVHEIRRVSVVADECAGALLWDNSSGNSVWGTAIGEECNWAGNFNPGTQDQIIFDDSFICTAQNIDIQDQNWVVSDIRMRGPHSYTVGSSENRQLRMNSDTAAFSLLNLETNCSGQSADMTVNAQVRLFNDLNINNNTANKLTIREIRNRTYDVEVNNSGTVEVTERLRRVNGPNAGGGLTKNGTGTLILSGTSAQTNNFRGDAVINNGTVILNKTGGGNFAIGNGNNSDIHINGGTLLLGGNNQIHNAQDMFLAGGTFNSGGFDDSLGTLTLSSTSTLDMGSGSSTINFTDFSYGSGTLNIYNWSGIPNTAGGTDQVIFNTAFATNLSNINFYSDNGTTFLGNGMFIGNELVPNAPVPESSSYIQAILILCSGYVLWRRKKIKT